MENEHVHTAPISLKDYQKQVRVGFKDHEALPAYQARLSDWGLGLAGESGEVCEHLKHYIFGSESIKIMEIAKELGDVLWYITAVAETLGIPMQDIMDLNIAKLKHRYNGTGEYNDQASAGRHQAEVKFESTEDYKYLHDRIISAAIRNSEKVRNGKDE